MRHSKPRRAYSLRWTALLLCFLVCVTGLPAEQQKKTPPEPLAGELKRIRTAIINASSKLNNDIVGVTAKDDSIPPTPARSCCSSNLLRIEKSAAELERLLQEFDRCFEKELDQAMLLTTRMAKTDLESLEKTVSLFADAMVKTEAKQGIVGITRAFTQLEGMLSELRPCSGVEPAPPEDTPGGN